VWIFVACDQPFCPRLTLHNLAAVAEDEARLTALNLDVGGQDDRLLLGEGLTSLRSLKAEATLTWVLRGEFCWREYAVTAGGVGTDPAQP